MTQKRNSTRDGADKLAISQNKAMMCEEISPMNNKLKLHFHHQLDLESGAMELLIDSFGKTTGAADALENDDRSGTR